MPCCLPRTARAATETISSIILRASPTSVGAACEVYRPVARVCLARVKRGVRRKEGVIRIGRGIGSGLFSLLTLEGHYDIFCRFAVMG